MTTSKGDALSALNDIEATERRSRTLFGYGQASPYLLLWGALWIVAGAVGALSPGNSGFGWAAVDTVGIGGTVYLAVRQARRCGERGERLRLLRHVGTIVALAAFIGLTLMTFAPVSGAEVQMLVTLLVAAGYAVAGCWIGLRYAIIGVALGALAAGVFHLAPAQLPLILTMAGGGALILGGLWMRRA